MAEPKTTSKPKTSRPPRVRKPAPIQYDKGEPIIFAGCPARVEFSYLREWAPNEIEAISQEAIDPEQPRHLCVLTVDGPKGEEWIGGAWWRPFNGSAAIVDAILAKIDGMSIEDALDAVAGDGLMLPKIAPPVFGSDDSLVSEELHTDNHAARVVIGGCAYFVETIDETLWLVLDAEGMVVACWNENRTPVDWWLAAQFGEIGTRTQYMYDPCRVADRVYEVLDARAAEVEQLALGEKESVARGLEDAAAGRTHDLGSFGEDLDVEDLEDLPSDPDAPKHPRMPKSDGFANGLNLVYDHRTDDCFHLSVSTGHGTCLAKGFRPCEYLGGRQCECNMYQPIQAGLDAQARTGRYDRPTTQ